MSKRIFCGLMMFLALDAWAAAQEQSRPRQSTRPERAKPAVPRRQNRSPARTVERPPASRARESRPPRISRPGNRSRDRRSRDSVSRPPRRSRGHVPPPSVPDLRGPGRGRGRRPAQPPTALPPEREIRQPEARGRTRGGWSFGEPERRTLRPPPPPPPKAPSTVETVQARFLSEAQDSSIRNQLHSEQFKQLQANTCYPYPTGGYPSRRAVSCESSHWLYPPLRIMGGRWVIPRYGFTGTRVGFLPWWWDPRSLTFTTRTPSFHDPLLDLPSTVVWRRWSIHHYGVGQPGTVWPSWPQWPPHPPPSLPHRFFLDWP